jgi:hypothetical protein
MKKSELKDIIAEVIKQEFTGYSNRIGKTKGGTSNEFSQILTKIAKGEPSKTTSNQNLKEADEKEYKVEYAYRYGKEGDDTDFETIKVKASSESEAIEKAKQEAKRLAIQSSFKVKK